MAGGGLGYGKGVGTTLEESTGRRACEMGQGRMTRGGGWLDRGRI